MSELVSSEHAPSLTASYRDHPGSLLGYQGRVLRVGQKLMTGGGVAHIREFDAAERDHLLQDPARELYEARGDRMIPGHELAAELTADLLIIEYAAPDDSMSKHPTLGCEELHQGLTHDLFEGLCRRHFDIVRVRYEEGATRWLYLLRRR